ncbi:MAG: MarR family transcriptional regulator [Bacillota bacterium]
MCRIKADPVTELDELLNQLIQKVTRDVLFVIKGKVSASQFAIMRVLRQTGRSTVTGIAEQLEITLSGVTALSDRLVEADLVERVRDEQDRRVVWIDLSEKGRELVVELEGVKRGMVERYVEGLSESEVRKLNDIMRKILRA